MVGYHGGFVDDVDCAVAVVVGVDGGGFEGEVELSGYFHAGGVDVAEVLVEAVEVVDHGVDGGGFVARVGDIGEYFCGTAGRGKEAVGAFLVVELGDEEFHEGGFAGAGISGEDEDPL